ncbi:flagellar export chaperone FliS [Caproiciproducens sp. LBM24188]|jgi:flagellar protein FliS|nr:flagellar export chaperone FliS [Oscillospiraceae bacterium]HHV31945.1 flagellar export chaperone FliS [Clostridiales bacterium]
MQNNPIMQYKEQVINTMTKGEQLVLLFDEILKNLHYGSMMMKDGNYPTSQKCTEKCKEIFRYLSSILDMSNSISGNLYDLYYFANQQIIRAEVKRDPSLLDDLAPLVQDMRDTWAEAERLTHIQK